MGLDSSNERAIEKQPKIGEGKWSFSVKARNSLVVFHIENPDGGLERKVSTREDTPLTSLQYSISVYQG